jgi:hypothetical protein
MFISVRKNLPPNCCFTREQLECIAAAMCVSGVDSNTKSVYFSETPPPNPNTPWQKTDCCGNPVGKILFYKDGIWQ